MRYLPLTQDDRIDMLARIGAPDIDALFASIPESKRLSRDLELPQRKTEIEVQRLLSDMAAKNVAAGSAPFFVGAGAYRHHIPASVDHLIQRSEFMTSYTPYQPEIAQGTLQAIFEFQTQVAALTAMDVANASMYDGSTATIEAVLMAHRITKRRKAVLSGGLHPHYAEVVRTISRMTGDDVSASRRMFWRGKISPTRSIPAHPASSFKTPTSSAICAMFPLCPRYARRRARCSSSSSPRPCLSASSRRRARWAPTSRSAKGNRLATA